MGRVTADAPSFPPLTAPPPERLDVDGGVALVRCDPGPADALVAAINASLEHLQPWMAWASEPATSATMSTFLVAQAELWDQCRDFGYSIVDTATDDVIGGCGLHNRLGPGALEIGYWVHVDRAGQGLASRGAGALTEAAFALAGIARVEIHCDEENHRSARVPEKLGYTFEGLQIPEAGPCAGRSTQIWTITEPVWRAGTP